MAEKVEKKAVAKKKKYNYKYESTNLRWDEEEYQALRKAAHEAGMSSTSKFIKYVMSRVVKFRPKKKKQHPK